MFVKFCIGFCTKSFSREEADDVDDDGDDDDDDESYHPSGDESYSEEDTLDDLGKLKTKWSMHLTTFKLWKGN